MQKLSSEKVAQILGQVGPTLRALADENQSLKEKVAFYEKRERVEKIASEMETKNLDPESSYEQKVENLLGQDSENLDVVEKAIEMSAPQIKLAALSDHPGNPSDAASTFASAIVGD